MLPSTYLAKLQNTCVSLALEGGVSPCPQVRAAPVVRTITRCHQLEILHRGTGNTAVKVEAPALQPLTPTWLLVLQCAPFILCYVPRMVLVCALRLRACFWRVPRKRFLPTIQSLAICAIDWSKRTCHSPRSPARFICVIGQHGELSSQGGCKALNRVYLPPCRLSEYSTSPTICVRSWLL